ncbi:MAG TPA: 5'-3' exonuclease [Virgibacillus sp.]|nr:5'-3' exonuclease [Virgibacillus sp.]HLR68848.1 5'-3' exonuclease [Virgibacillus sp.]
MKNTQADKLLLVDGMALLFRGYFATAYSKQFMRREDGTPTNGVFQFLKYFIDGIQTFQPSHVICCWDMGKQTFRTSLYDSYKANRADPPEELIPQFDLAKEAVDAFSIPNIGLVNYEADDVIGSLAHQYKDEYDVIIQSGDQDLLQLVDTNVQVAIMRKGIGNYEVFHQENFFDKRGLHPHQIIEYKAFTGDSADNYPGIKGIGEKTALKLLQTYGSMDGILSMKQKLTKGIQQKLQDDIEMFHLCKKLAEIKCDVPVELIMDEAEISFNLTDIHEKIENLGIRSRALETLGQ